MQLLGSVTSPFVRRIRLLLEHQKRDYELVPINVYDVADQQRLAKLSPAMRVPVLVDGDQVIWDSLLICEYLEGAAADLATKKLLVLINEANDAGVTLFQFQKFGMGHDSTYAKHSQRRLQTILTYLDQHACFQGQNAADWQTPQMCLYAMLDWLQFREVIDWPAQCPQLVSFFALHGTKPGVAATNPR